MGFLKVLALESRVFTIAKDKNLLVIIEKSKKVLKMLRLALELAQWLVKSLGDNLKTKDFYSTVSVTPSSLGWGMSRACIKKSDKETSN